ncbi:YigZ family protein [Methylococcus sp. EFPC2]|uniref:IMPACT family protein n=1 Tax=Methylococcus sp. EFPC2 TaxID=2812648 RepID=UPI0019671090|nr:YigZ family protein [Methylococcus sp. EFPC2]QSA96622.1 YigZ family protein [Methylococcus sp. EFPC2]
MSAYFTLAELATHQEEVKASVFIAYADRADTPELALRFLNGVLQRHPDASHLCWAYKIGQQYRFSDGGEPGGTAGQPILRAIDGMGLDHVVVGVIRYFGGTKLGAGGLMRAYGGVAAEALRSAPKREESPRETLTVEVFFEHLGVLYRLLDSHGAEERAEEYHERGVKLRFTLAQAEIERFQTGLRDATKGRSASVSSP